MKYLVKYEVSVETEAPDMQSAIDTAKENLNHGEILFLDCLILEDK